MSPARSGRNRSQTATPTPTRPIAGLFEPQVLRIGVTGLSQSGKSTLITSLINHLENIRRGALRGQVALSMLVHGHWQREGVERPFDYDVGLHALTDHPPHWPDSTRDWSVARIELTRTRRWYQPGSRRRIIELVDYPGEWLLDLMLLDLDYGQWCRATADWLDESPRAELGAELRTRLRAIDPTAPVERAMLQQLQQDWAGFLADCRLPPQRLSRNLPGRFLIPGDAYDPRVKPFVPLLDLPADADCPPGSWGAVCAAHYESYRNEVVRPFFEQHFSQLDAQVILIDLLGAMSAGQAALKDMRAAVDAVLQPFRYGQDGWLTRLFRRRLRRVAVCASQIDHVLPEDQKRLQQLLESYLYETVQRLAGESIEMQVMAVSAVRAARLADPERPAAGLIGRDKRSGERIRFTPPGLPTSMPHNLDVRIDALPQLAPPEGLDRAQVFPGRRIDQLIAFLLAE